MARMIDADELKNILEMRHEQCEGEYGSLQGAVRGFIKLLDKQPTVDAEPVRRGKWIDVYGGYLFECSKCKAQVNSNQFKSNLKYCPNCGAKMEECENG